MAHSERSAGFIIFAQRENGGPPEFLLLDYGKHWDFPKGHVEAGEDDLATARRELQEETGLVDIVPIPGFHEEMSYFFRNKRHGLVRKTVVFFLAEAKSRKIKLSREHIAYAFVEFEKALKHVTFPSAKQLLRKAWERLNASD